MLPVKNPDAIPPNGWHITVILADELEEVNWNCLFFKLNALLKLFPFENVFYLPSHVTWSGVIESVSFELWAEFKPFKAGINMVE